MFDRKNKFEIADHRLSPTAAIIDVVRYGRWRDGRFKNQVSRSGYESMYFNLPTFWSCDQSGDFRHVEDVTYNHHARSLYPKSQYDKSNSHYTNDIMLGKNLRFSK